MKLWVAMALALIVCAPAFADEDLTREKDQLHSNHGGLLRSGGPR